MADGKIIIDTDLDSSGAKQGLNRLTSIVNTSFKGITTSILSVSSVLGGLGVKAVSVGADFSSSMSKVYATMGITIEEINAGSEAVTMLKNAAKQCGETTQFSASQAAEALNYIALAGYDANDAVELLPKTLNLAAAGGLDLATATDLVTDACSALLLEGKDVDKLIDQMARTSQKSNTTVEMLGKAILKVGNTATFLSGGITEMNTALGLFANVGIKAEDGGIRLRNIILSLTAPSTEAAAAMLETVNVFDEATGAMRPLNEIFEDINGQLATMTQGERIAWISKVFNKTDIASVNSLIAATSRNMDELEVALSSAGIETNSFNISLTDLADNFDTAATAEENINKIMALTGVSAEEAGTIYQGLNSVLNENGTAWDDLAAKIADCDGAAADMAKTLNDNLKGDIIILGSALEGLGISIAETQDTYIRGIVQELTEYVSQLNSSFKSDGFKGFATELGNISADLITKLASDAPKFMQIAIDTINSFIEGLNSNAPEITAAGIEILGTLMNGIVSIIPNLVELGFTIVSNLANSIASSLTAISQCGQETINTFVDSVISFIGNIIDSGMDIILALVDGLIAALPVLLPAVVEIMIALVNKILEHLPELIEAGLQLIVALGQGILNCLPTLLGNMGAILGNLMDTSLSFCADFLQAGTEFIYNLINGLIQAVPSLLGAIVNIGWQIISSLTKFTGDMLTTGITLIGYLASGIVASVSNIVSAIFQIGSSIINGLMSIPGQVVQIGRDIISGLYNGLVEKIGWLTDKVKGMFSGIVSTVKGIFDIHSPSRVFKSIGGFVAEGFGVGFEDEFADVEQDINSEFNSFVDSINLSAIVDVTSDIMGASVASGTNITNNYTTVNSLGPVPSSRDEQREITINVPVQIDGKNVAEVTAPHSDKLSGQRLNLSRRGLVFA